jgi:vitamin B12 transporter
MNIRLKPLAALLPLAISGSAIADTQLETMVVSASRQPTRASELLADVTVVDREDIERNGQGSVADLLARQPGVQMSSNGGPGTTTSLYVRGSRPDQTKILVDGIPVNSIDLSGSPLRFLPLADVERIEILRGPAATLYGADAVGGVIQVFTRRGAPGLRADGFVGYGTQNTWQASAGISGGNEHWRFRVDGDSISSDSISSRRHASNRDVDTDPYRNSGGSASLSFLPAQGHEMGISYRHNEGLTHFDNNPPNGTFDARIVFESEQWQVFSRNRITDDWSSKLQYGEASDYQKNYLSFQPAGSYLQTQNRFLSWQNDVKLPLGKGLLAVERLEQEASPRDRFSGNAQIAVNSVLAGWTGNVGAHRWQINGRRDEHSTFGGQNTYSLAYGYQLSDFWRSHVSYGTAFKAPSIYQLFVPVYGNSQLTPEQARNREAAIIWENGNQLASATYYLNSVHNLIDYSMTTSSYQNISQARLEGVTLSYALRAGDWSLNAAYDWLNATNEETGKELGRRAKNKASLAINRKWGSFESGVELIGVGNRYDKEGEKNKLPGYALVNLTGRYPLARDWSIEGRLNNLFDKKYDTALNYATPGFNAFIGVRYSPQ